MNLGGVHGDDQVDRRFYAMQGDAGGQRNVLGLVDERGLLVERYEYTLYGEREVYRRSEFELGRVARFDFDGDHDFDNSDSQTQIGNFTGPGSFGKTHAQGDTDGDGDVDNTDTQAAIAIAISPRMPGNDAKALTPAAGSAWIKSSGVTLNPFGFQGLRHDEATGTIDNRARLYLPDLERFAQRDPLGYPDGMNSYAAYHVLRQGLKPQCQSLIRLNHRPAVAVCCTE